MIKRTQTTNQDLKKGHYTRSKQRDRDEGSSGRTMGSINDCKHISPNNQLLMIAKDNIYYNLSKVPQTAKHASSKSVKFKPPLAPKHESITGCARYAFTI
jgi:hypothetical protein